MAPCNHGCMQVDIFSPNIYRYLSSCSDYLHRRVFKHVIIAHTAVWLLFTGYSIPRPTMIKALRWITYINVSFFLFLEGKLSHSSLAPSIRVSCSCAFLLVGRFFLFTQKHYTALRQCWWMNSTHWTEYARTLFPKVHLTKMSRLPIKFARLLDLYLVKSLSMVIVSGSCRMGSVIQTHGGYVHFLIL